MDTADGQRVSPIAAGCDSFEELLDAAEDQLREEELAFFTVASVLDRTGGSVGSLYRRFPSKDHLIRAVFERFRTRMQPILLAALEAEKFVPESLEEAVDHAFGILTDHVLTERQLSRAFMLLSAFDPDIRTGVKALNLERKNAVSAVLAAHSAEIRHPDPDVAIHQAFQVYFATMQGRLVFFAPSSNPSMGESDEFVFAQLRRAIAFFLCASDPSDTWGTTTDLATFRAKG